VSGAQSQAEFEKIIDGELTAIRSQSLMQASR